MLLVKRHLQFSLIKLAYGDTSHELHKMSKLGASINLSDLYDLTKRLYHLYKEQDINNNYTIDVVSDGT